MRLRAVSTPRMTTLKLGGEKSVWLWQQGEITQSTDFSGDNQLRQELEQQKQ